MILAGAVVANLLWVGCSKDPVTPEPTPQPPFAIDDDIVLEVSPEVAASSVVGDESTFELDALSLVQSGEFNEFDIGYDTPNTCDRNVDVLNHGSLQWDRFAFNPPIGVFCLLIITPQTHILGEQKLSAGDYVDTNKRMKLRDAPAGVTVRALRINPKYKTLSLAATDATWARGIHYDGSLWLGQIPMFKMTTSGDVLEEIDTPVSSHNGLAWDGEKFWTAWNDAGQWRIRAFDKTGALSCSFDVAQTLEGGLTFAQDKLWVGAKSGPDPEILVIDPPSSCLDGNAQIDKTIALVISEINAMASDGTHIYVATDDEVIKLTTDEVVAGTYALPVDDVRGMSWHSGGLWMIHRGPVGVRTGAYFVSRFQLP